MSFIKCLSANDIKYTLTEQEGRLDKRTNNINKKNYRVYIGSKNIVENLQKICKFTLKNKGD